MQMMLGKLARGGEFGRCGNCMGACGPRDEALTAEISLPPADTAAIVDANLRGVVPTLAHA